MKYAIAFTFVSLLTAAVGCGNEITACTEEARYSVIVELENRDGEPVSGAEMTYSVDGGAENECRDNDNGSYSCGTEEEGEITVRATHEGYTSDVEETVTVGADECHVITETLMLTII